MLNMLLIYLRYLLPCEWVWLKCYFHGESSSRFWIKESYPGKNSWKTSHHFICFRRGYMTWWFGSLWPFDKIGLQTACSGAYKDGLNFENTFRFYCSVGSFYFFMRQFDLSFPKKQLLSPRIPYLMTLYL